MLVKRRGSAKRKRRTYEALKFGYASIQEMEKFLEGFGKVDVIDEGWTYSIWIVLEGNRKVGPGQIMIKDDWRKRILTFDQTIFYDLFE